MRLRAMQEVNYGGKTWQPGMLFDALPFAGRDMIGKGQAVIFNLEDPANRTLNDILFGFLPQVPPVTLSPTSASLPPGAAAGQTFSVTVNGQGQSGTWTVSQDASATWITIVSPLSPQANDGVVTYNVAANAGAQRVANMYVNGKTFQVTQLLGP